MSTILESLIEDYKESDFDTQLKIICDQIYEEEKGSLKNPELEPKGPNIFLSIQIQSKDNSISFLTLERFIDREYCACVWNLNSDGKPLKFKVVNLKQNDDVKKLLKEFARHYKIMKGRN